MASTLFSIQGQSLLSFLFLLQTFLTFVLATPDQNQWAVGRVTAGKISGAAGMGLNLGTA